MKSCIQNTFEKDSGKSVNFIKDNHTKLIKGLLHGLHCQLNADAQSKLIRCIVGEVFDIAINLKNNHRHFKIGLVSVFLRNISDSIDT